MQNMNAVKPSPKSWLERQMPEEEERPSPFFIIEKQQGKRAVHIDFHFENGNHLGLPCSDLRKIEFKASKGITLFWPDETIHVMGRNLSELYQQLLLHRVTAIIEDAEEEAVEGQLAITTLMREDESLE